MVGRNVMPSRHSDIFYSLSFNLLSFIVMLDSNKNALAHTFAAFRELIFIFFGCFFLLLLHAYECRPFCFSYNRSHSYRTDFGLCVYACTLLYCTKLNIEYIIIIIESLTAIWQSTHASDEEYNCQWTPRNLNHASCEYYLCRCLLSVRTCVGMIQMERFSRSLSWLVNSMNPFQQRAHPMNRRESPISFIFFHNVNISSSFIIVTTKINSHIFTYGA